MKDKHTQERVLLLHPKIREAAESAINECENTLNITLRVVQGYRTFDEQEAIYQQGRSKKFDEKGNPLSIVTYSPPGSSYHNYGLAVDVCPLVQKTVNGKPTVVLDWNYAFINLLPIFTKYGFTWGGKFKHIDADHFENKLGYGWQQLLVMYNNKNFIEGTTYVNI